MKNEYFELNNGYKIPSLGFGTFRTKSGFETEESVFVAIKEGFRHIDCAAAYRNQTSVAVGIQRSGVKREDLFITSKLWNDDKGYEETKAAFNQTIKDLGLEYLDLYLIHWPIGAKFTNNWEQANADSWRAMEELYKEGKIKSIGVSNFRQHHLEALMKTATIKPMVNQIEIHPGLLQEELVKYCEQQQIVIEAWAPFSNGEVFKNVVLAEIAAKYSKNIAQVVLQWIVRKGIVALPKSITPERIKMNLDVDSFELSKEDLLKIDAIHDLPGSGLDPDHADF